MKTKTMAGILTLTAGLATQVAMPSYALARTTQSEPSFAKEFNLKSASVRVKQEDGTYSVGHIYLNVYQERLTPEDANQFHAEMTGYLTFNSESGDNYINLAAGDGDILMDLVNKDAGNTYQIYGCSSTLTDCIGSSLQVTFQGPLVTLQFHWSSTQKFETWNEIKQVWEEAYSVILKKLN